MAGVVKVIAALLALEIVSALVTAIVTGLTAYVFDRLVFRDVEPADLPLAKARIVRR